MRLKFSFRTKFLLFKNHFKEKITKITTFANQFAKNSKKKINITILATKMADGLGSSAISPYMRTYKYVKHGHASGCLYICRWNGPLAILTFHQRFHLYPSYKYLFLTVIFQVFCWEKLSMELWIYNNFNKLKSSKRTC